MPKIKGYAGWRKARKTGKRFWNFVSGPVKIGEASIEKVGSRFYASVWYSIGEMGGHAERMADTMADAQNWLNKKRRIISRRVFG